MAFCNRCGAQIADGTTTCAACAGQAQAIPVQPAQQAAQQGMTDNVAGLLAYITFIPAIVFLMVEPYSRNRFIRFHSFQSLFFTVALVIAHVALVVLGAIPLMALLTFPLHILLNLAAFIIWIVLILKASQGQMFKLPIIGDMSEKQAAAM